jgi:hypothetical protein
MSTEIRERFLKEMAESLNMLPDAEFAGCPPEITEKIRQIEHATFATMMEHAQSMFICTDNRQHLASMHKALKKDLEQSIDKRLPKLRLVPPQYTQLLSKAMKNAYNQQLDQMARWFYMIWGERCPKTCKPWEYIEIGGGWFC